MKLRISLLAAIALLTALVPGHAAVTFSSGHADIGFEYEGPGQLSLHFHIHAGATVDGATIPADEEYAPEDAAVLVSNSAYSVQSSSDLVAGTGVGLGSSIWRLPENNNPLLPFLGFGAEELSAGDWLGNLSYSLVSVISPSGNGHFSVYQSDGLGGWNFFMSTTDGITMTDKVEIVAEGHDHYNWTFSEAGNWTVNMVATGNHATDGAQTSGVFSFNFVVTPEPSRVIFTMLGLTSILGRRRRKSELPRVTFHTDSR